MSPLCDEMIQTARCRLAQGRRSWKMHQAIPGSRFVAFERSGHLPFLEEPEAFVRATEELLGKK